MSDKGFKRGEGRKLVEDFKKQGITVTMYTDMDGVVADFEGTAEELGIAFGDFKLIRGSYRKIKPYPNAFKFLDLIEEQLGVTVHLLTKIPDENPYAATEKLLWLHEHAPHRAVDVTITPDKGSVGAEMDFLIDDRPHKAKVHNFKGTLLHFGDGGMFKDWYDLLEYFDIDPELINRSTDQ